MHTLSSYLRTSLRQARGARGFTLVETLVAITVFAVVVGVTSSIFFDAFATERKTQVSRALFEETRIALERVVKEVRRGTIDYEEYWNWYRCRTATCETVFNASEPDQFYGRNYGAYAVQFFRDANDAVPTQRATHGRHDENVGVTENANAADFAIQSAGSHPGCQTADTPSYVAPATNAYEQCELYLVSADGTEKTILKVAPVTVTHGGVTRTEYRLMMLRLDGQDAGYDGSLATIDADGSQSDGQIETWVPASGFTDGADAVFRAIQPDTLAITDVRFFISPLADPRKAFAQFDDDVQMQPHVTILLTAEPSGVQVTADGHRVLPGIRGAAPSITLQTTVTARAQHEILSLK